MKKTTFTFLIASLFAFATNAQPCGSGTNGPTTCVPTGGPVNGGFQNLDNITCIEKGVYYGYAIQFKMFSTFNFQGFQNVDSIEFTDIDNLPCGICWSVNKATKRYKKDELGCLYITGTTNDAAGQYKLGIGVKAWINGDPAAVPVNAFLFNQTGVKVIVRVKNNGAATCAVVDTAENAASNRTAATGCVVGINEVSSRVSDLRIAPSPVSENAVVTFYAESGSVYNVKISDMTGKTVSDKLLEVRAGANSTTIERGNLAAGVYLLSLTDGKNAVTRRFAIVD